VRTKMTLFIPALLFILQLAPRAAAAPLCTAGQVLGFKSVTGASAHLGAVVNQDGSPDNFENLTNTLSFSAMQGTIYGQDSLSLFNLEREFGYVGNVDHPGSLTDQLSFTSNVPEPMSILLSGIGLLGLGLWRRRSTKL
jgi:hypothetical protein